MNNDRTFYASNNPEGKPKSTDSSPAPDLNDGVGETSKSNGSGGPSPDDGVRIEEIEVVDDTAPKFSEQGVAIEFAARYADQIRYVPQLKQWLVFDDKRGCWVVDHDNRLILGMANQVCREYSRIAGKRALALAKASFRSAIVSLCADDAQLAATPEQFDRDPWLLNTPSGIVDLRTGRMRDARPGDYMRQITRVAPRVTRADGNNCPRWLAFLREIMGGNDEMVTYLQRVAGYCLTGSIREQQMWCGYGSGNNGKDVFLEVVSELIGDSAATAEIETFTVNKNPRHSTELARLQGKRLVISSESDEGKRWAEARIKNITGGGKITAHLMYKDDVEYRPQFKLFVIANHMPILRNVGAAIRRRFNRVPFTVTIPPERVNKNLAAELIESEGPGILLWAIAGCLEWQKNGLDTPAAVKASTEGYLASQDLIGAWIADCCEEGGWAGTAELFQSWKVWADARQEFVGSVRSLSMKLEDRGWLKGRDKTRTLHGFAGWRLKGDTQAAREVQAATEAAVEDDLPF